MLTVQKQHSKLIVSMLFSPSQITPHGPNVDAIDGCTQPHGRQALAHVHARASEALGKRPHVAAAYILTQKVRLSHYIPRIQANMKYSTSIKQKANELTSSQKSKNQLHLPFKAQFEKTNMYFSCIGFRCED
jgi:hypothetical protein